MSGRVLRQLSHLLRGRARGYLSRVRLAHVAVNERVHLRWWRPSSSTYPGPPRRGCSSHLACEPSGGASFRFAYEIHNEARDPGRHRPHAPRVLNHWPPRNDSPFPTWLKGDHARCRPRPRHGPTLTEAPSRSAQIARDLGRDGGVGEGGEGILLVFFFSSLRFFIRCIKCFYDLVYPLLPLQANVRVWGALGPPVRTRLPSRVGLLDPRPPRRARQDHHDIGLARLCGGGSAGRHLPARAVDRS